MLTAPMVQLQRALPGVDVRFLSFSVDPANDTPAVLAAYAKKWAPDEPRWTLLATDAETLPVTAAGFHVTAEKNKPGGAPVPHHPHSSVFVLVDRAGMVRGVYDSEHREDLKALANAVRTLAGAQTPPPVQGAVSGLELYHSESCATCHEAPSSRHRSSAELARVSPSTTASPPRSTPSTSRSRCSRPTPNARRATRCTCPATTTSLAEALLAPTKYALEAPRNGPVATAEVPVEVDPVCHMKVRATPDALARPSTQATASSSARRAASPGSRRRPAPFCPMADKREASRW